MDTMQKNTAPVADPQSGTPAPPLPATAVHAPATPPPLSTAPAPQKKKKRGCLWCFLGFVLFVAVFGHPDKKAETEKNAQNTPKTAAQGTAAVDTPPTQKNAATPQQGGAAGQNTPAETTAPAPAEKETAPAPADSATPETAAADDDASIWEPIDPAEKKLNKLTDEEIEEIFRPSVAAVRRESEIIGAAVAHAEKIKNRATADKYADAIAKDVQLMDEALKARFLQPLNDAEVLAQKAGVSTDDAEAAIEKGGVLYNRLPKEVRNAQAIWEFENTRWMKQVNRLNDNRHFDSVKLFSALKE